jgi:hypothetical protein
MGRCSARVERHQGPHHPRFESQLRVQLAPIETACLDVATH